MAGNSATRALVAAFVGTAMALLVGAWAQADGPRDHALFDAIRRGDRALLESHLREGAPVNAKAADGTTPLMLAARYGTADTLRLLLDSGADPRAANDSGATALVLAAGDFEKVRLLVDRGADVHAETKLGNTPLISAAAYVGNLETVKLLLAKGADPHKRNKNGVAALTSAVNGNDAQTVRYLLAQGCKPEKIKILFGQVGNSLLELAAQNGNLEIIDMLLAAGAEVNSADTNFAGHALNYALLSQQPAVARRLIEAGADLNLCTPVGKVPPIVLAAYSETGDTSIVKLLVERGAKVDAASQAGETLLTWARRRGFPEVVAAASGAPEGTERRVEPPKRDIQIDAENRPALVRAAVEKSIALMQHSSDVFLKLRRGCVSCHHQNLPAVALGWARDRGFAIDEKSAAAMIERQQVTWSRRMTSIVEMDNPFPVPPQFLGYGLWGASALGTSGDALSDATVLFLAATQQPDGHWLALFSRPPVGDGEILSTVLAMRSLQLYEVPARREELQARVARAKRWLIDAKPLTHQERVYKLLGLAWTGVPVDQLRGELDALLAAQRPDGGWPQLQHMTSDAWATGQSLVALRVAGRMAADDPAFQRGVDYLLSTQFDDGSWYVLSRTWPFQPPFDSEFPFGKDQWVSVGATAWAVMGLVQSIDPSSAPRVPSKTDTQPEVLATADPPAATKTAAPAATPTPAGPIDFVKDIKPVLERSCAGCHSGETPEGNFRVTAREALLGGGESGERAVVPGKSGESPLVARAAGADADLAMPPRDKRDKFPALSADELQALRAWIDQGAAWPEGAKIEPPPY